MHPVKEENMICRDDTPLHAKRAANAARVYNELHQILCEWGWTERMGEATTFCPNGVPDGVWTHPEVQGSCSMTAAYAHVVLAREERRRARGEGK